MIVRILSEGQYRLDSDHLDHLNEIDNRLVEVVAKGNEEEYHRLFAEMLAHVREKGKPVPATELVASDVVVPAPDTTLDEAKRLFTAEGIVPG